ncbi:hypothetical protein ACOSQ4_026868 [Xanthoceras sorbifolium]
MEGLFDIPISDLFLFRFILYLNIKYLFCKLFNFIYMEKPSLVFLTKSRNLNVLFLNGIRFPNEKFNYYSELYSDFQYWLYSDPFSIHHYDNTNAVLVSPVLSGDNSGTWSRVITKTLQTKNKLGFIDGSIIKQSIEKVYS